MVSPLANSNSTIGVISKGGQRPTSDKPATNSKGSFGPPSSYYRCNNMHPDKEEYHTTHFVSVVPNKQLYSFKNKTAIKNKVVFISL